MTVTVMAIESQSHFSIALMVSHDSVTRAGRELRDYLRLLALGPSYNTDAPEAKAGAGAGAVEEGSEHRQVYMPKWKTRGECLAFPATSNAADMNAMETALADLNTQTADSRASKPLDHDGAAMGDKRPRSASEEEVFQRLRQSTALKDRLEVFSAGRQVLPFDAKIRDTKVLHFAAYPKQGYRLLTHWYTFFFFADPALDRATKRFVREHFRYRDRIWCMANRVLRALREEARAIAAASTLQQSLDLSRSFSAFHIRHGDFQVSSSSTHPPMTGELHTAPLLVTVYSSLFSLYPALSLCDTPSTSTRVPDT